MLLIYGSRKGNFLRHIDLVQVPREGCPAILALLIQVSVENKVVVLALFLVLLQVAKLMIGLLLLSLDPIHKCWSKLLALLAMIAGTTGAL